VHCFLKWLRLFIGGLSTGDDSGKELGFINTIVNSQIGSCELPVIPKGESNESVSALFPQMVETIHRWAQYWR